MSDHIRRFPMRWLTAVALFICVSTQHSSAQTEERGTMPLSEGFNYMVAFPQVWASPSEKPLNPAMTILISSRVATTVKLTTPATINQAARIDREYTLQPNTVLTIPISTSYMNVESESHEGYGISLQANHPISVFTRQGWQGNGEVARHLPIEAWGTSYRTMNFYQDRYGAGNGYKYRPSQVLIVASEDNTSVTYTPTVKTEGGTAIEPVLANASATVKMQRGETFLIKGAIDETKTKDWRSDMSGTLITSTKPIAVISGHTKVGIMRYPDVLPPTGMFASEAHFIRNNVHDAMLPLEFAGTSFIAVPFIYTPIRVFGQQSVEHGIDPDSGDVIRIMALQNSTKVNKVDAQGKNVLVRTLDAGMSYLDTVFTKTTMFTTSKPVMFGQYGKSYAKLLPPKAKTTADEVQGHPTVESGMPTFTTVPSINRWTNYGVFSSFEGMDNFVNIVFKTMESDEINFDGLPISEKFGSAIKALPTTPYSYVQLAVSAGTHIIESTTNDVRWCAIAYSSYDGIERGRAHSTPVAYDLSIPSNDELSLSDSGSCDVGGVFNVSSTTDDSASVYMVYADSLNNYSFQTQPSADRKSTAWQLNVISPTADASAVVTMVSRTGKFIRKTYSYKAERVEASAGLLDFGSLKVGRTSCKTLEIKNKQNDKPLSVKDIHAKNHPENFIIIPNSFVIPSGGSQVVTVCATPDIPRLRLDSLVVELECYESSVTELHYDGEHLAILAGDATWKVKPGNAWHPESFYIVNPSGDYLTITGFDSTVFEGSHFRVDGGFESLPIILAGGDRHRIDVSFNPFDTYGTLHAIDVEIYSDATANTSDKIVHLSGVVDSVATSVSEEDESSVRITPIPVIRSQHSDFTVAYPAPFTSIAIYNMFGAKVFEQELPASERVTLPSRLLNSSGMYSVRLSAAHQDVVVPLICLD